jgi:hypothetical protein
MGRIGSVFFAILAIFLLLGPFRTPITDGITGLRTVDTTESFAVTTAAGVTSANVTLGSDLYQDLTSNVISFTSTVDEDPVASTYTTATNVLLVSALDADSSRTLTINYYAETDSDTWRAVGPFPGFLIFGILLFIIVAGIFKKGRR